MRDIKLVAFDVDGVLVEEPGSWYSVHKGLGTIDSALVNSQAFFDEKISFSEWARRDVMLWEGVEVARIQGILDGVPLMAGARETIPLIKKKYRVAIVSGGLKLLAQRLDRLFGFDYVEANELKVSDGKVVGFSGDIDFEGKGRILEKIAEDAGVTLKECAAVGDHVNDVPLFGVAGYSIAFNPKHKKIMECADEIIYEKDLTRLLDLL